MDKSGLGAMNSRVDQVESSFFFLQSRITVMESHNNDFKKIYLHSTRDLKKCVDDLHSKIDVVSKNVNENTNAKFQARGIVIGMVGIIAFLAGISGIYMALFADKV